MKSNFISLPILFVNINASFQVNKEEFSRNLQFAGKPWGYIDCQEPTTVNYATVHSKKQHTLYRTYYYT